MTTLWLDYETRSHCDLRNRGVYNYATDRSTEVLIASYAINGGKVKRWEKWRGKPMPMDLAHALTDRKVVIKAHNATFERLITQHVLCINVPLSRWYCTAFQARSLGLPSSLDDVARMVNPDFRKDARGADLIRRYSIPPYEDDAEGLTLFGEYCDQDVKSMRALSSGMPDLTAEAKRVWVANEVINDRGLPIDTELCELAQRYIEREAESIEARVYRLTGTRPRGQAIARWVYDRVPDDHIDLMHKGEDKITLDRAARNALLELDLGPVLTEVLELMDASSMSSTAKFRNFLMRASSDGRLRGAFVAAGAAATGRYASWGVQLHNLPRMSAKNPESIKRKMKRRERVSPEELKSMLRPVICAGPGKHIVRADWNAIEARGLPWLANTPQSRTYLGAFSDPTRDIYIEQAIAAGLGAARQEGKVVVLSLGYGGAEGALTKMAAAYGVDIPERPAVVARWRKSNGWAVEWWKELMTICTKSLRADTVRQAGRVQFVGPGVMQLPSGRNIFYPGLQTDDEGNLCYLKAARKPKKGEAWPLARLWHGILAENATQGACCDLLRDLTVREQDSPLIGHVHDECIAECDNEKEGKQWLQDAMLATSPWATGFPLRAEVASAKRFGK